MDANQKKKKSFLKNVALGVASAFDARRLLDGHGVEDEFFRNVSVHPRVDVAADHTFRTVRLVGHLLRRLRLGRDHPERHELRTIEFHFRLVLFIITRLVAASLLVRVTQILLLLLLLPFVVAAVGGQAGRRPV